MSDYQLPPEEIERLRSEGREMFQEQCKRLAKPKTESPRRKLVRLISRELIHGYMDARAERDEMLSGENVVPFPKGGAS